MTPIERLLEKLPDAKPCGSGWQACCPAHEDRNPSLSISEGDDGRALVKCHAGCSVDAVCDAVGLRVADLMHTADTFPMQSQHQGNGKTNGKPRIVAEYDYRDETGNTLFQAVRYDPKDFRQRRPDGKGGWIYKVKDVRVAPYRLPELLANPDAIVFVTEGEKDSDNLAKLEFVATCNAGGALKWKPEHSAFLDGRRVVILPDHDEPGSQHARRVAESLLGVAQSIKILKLPNLPEKGDVSDWIEMFSDAAEPQTIRAELLKLVEAAPVFDPDNEPWPALDAKAAPEGITSLSQPVLRCFADIAPTEVQWLWPDRFPLGRVSLLCGRPGLGKSFITTEMAALVSTGRNWPDSRECPQGSVIFMTAEDDPGDTIRPRLDAAGADVRKIHLLDSIRRVAIGSSRNDGGVERMISLADIDAIESALDEVRDCKLIIIDPIGSFLGCRVDAHRDNEVRSVLAPLSQLTQKTGSAVVLVAHQRKSAASHADDTVMGSRAFTGLARAVWHLLEAPMLPARRLLLAGKNNLAVRTDGLAFAIDGKPPRIIWEPDPVTITADEVFAAQTQPGKREPSGESQTKREATRACEWVRETLADGPMLATELSERWKLGEYGSERTLDRAMSSTLGEIVSGKEPGVKNGRWWRAIKGTPFPWESKDANSPEMETGTLGTLNENKLENSKDAKDANSPASTVV